MTRLAQSSRGYLNREAYKIRLVESPNNSQNGNLRFMTNRSIPNTYVLALMRKNHKCVNSDGRLLDEAHFSFFWREPQRKKSGMESHSEKNRNGRTTKKATWKNHEKKNAVWKLITLLKKRYEKIQRIKCKFEKFEMSVKFGVYFDTRASKRVYYSSKRSMLLRIIIIISGCNTVINESWSIQFFGISDITYRYVRVVIAGYGRLT